MNTEKMRANSLNGKEWLKNSFSIWRDIHKTRDEKNSSHPASFPVSLVDKILDCFVPKTEHTPVVLDPFAGSGSTLIASAQKQYHALGIDLNKEYKNTYQQSHSNLFNTANVVYISGDSSDIKNYSAYDKYDICITSPPYWDILNMKRSADKKNPKSYSLNINDIGNIKNYASFLKSLEVVFFNIFQVLRENSYFILNVGDIRKKSVFYPLHMDIVPFVQKTGFTLCDLLIWDRQHEYNSMRPLGYPYKFIVNKVHEYLLVFRKE